MKKNILITTILGRGLLVVAVWLWISQFVSFAAIIPANRLPPGGMWTAGVPGGIPNRMSIYTNLTGIDATGASDVTAAIQSALNKCPSNQVVKLPAGTFRINSVLVVPSYVTLRGSGIGQTVLSAYGSSGAVVAIGSSGYGINTANSTAVTSGDILAGATSITVGSTSGISVGTYLELTELNDTSLPVSSTGDEGACGWCDDWSGTRSAGQIVEVTSVSGNSIGFTPGAYLTYSNSLSPLATRFTASAKWAGVEDLTVFCNNTSAGVNFLISNGAYCWFRNVEGNFTDGDHCEFQYAYRCEVRHSYFHDAFIHGPGTYDATIMIDRKSSACLIEDNIFWRLHTSLILNRGASGNVVAYNYSTNMYTSGNLNFTPIDLDFCHGAHTMFNLMEGNVCVNIVGDSIWGSSSHNTAFRNYILGANWFSNPQDARYGASINTPLPAPKNLLTYPGVESYAEVCINVSDAARYYNIVGNVVGGQWVKTTGGHVFQTVTPQGLNLYGGYPYEFAFGYSESPGVRDNALAYSTAIIQGNWDIINNIQVWNSMSPTTLPNSYFLTSKPTYWGANQPWPPVDPTNPTMSNMTNIPAGYRFAFGVDPPTGSASPMAAPSPTILPALLSATPTVGKAPLTVGFSSGSQWSSNSLLDFGDGNTTTNLNPTHTYYSNWVYTITLYNMLQGTNYHLATYSNYITVTN